ncbi:MAG: DUF4860 domain-containing protein [Lachnospiraceae bacterium]|nr:DUF4860 domain-containing protein [Ruminococcus sp.]MCM1275136.1 DUF4860 domain-containing protein [Lachnospiraceae bacterium]
MKKYRDKTLSDTVGTIGSMLLFLMFAGCLLMMIAVAAGTYSRISSNFDRTFGSSASLRYVSNKLKSCDSAEIVGQGSGIVLKTDGISDVIYFNGGGLYEKTVMSDGDVGLSGGDRIFELNGMTIAEQGELYKITVSFEDGESSAFIRKG